MNKMQITVNPLRKINRSPALVGLGLVLSLSACGEGKSAGDTAKDITDAVVDKSKDVKDAVVDAAEDTKEYADRKFTETRESIASKYSELETKLDEETIPEFKAANQKRLDALNRKLAKADAALEKFRQSGETEWKELKATAEKSLTDAKNDLESFYERQEFKENTNSKLNKIEAKIESLKSESAKATGEAKKKLDEDIDNLQGRYDSLKAKYLELESIADDEWDDFKAGFKNAFDEISQSFKGLFDDE
jgi:tetrahydromethanopterin S-methyltransferase subunit G